MSFRLLLTFLIIFGYGIVIFMLFDLVGLSGFIIGSLVTLLSTIVWRVSSER